VQQPEEAAAEAEPERVERLRLPRQRGVVERQLLERVAQLRVASESIGNRPQKTIGLTSR
jgi:hypothetical protein